MIEASNSSPGVMQRSTKAAGIELSRLNRDGFKIEDTQISLEHFKWFVEEREKIRVLKEQGGPRPWTDDVVLDKTKFTNIYRQHDKVSKFIFHMVKDLSGPILTYNLLVSRLLNRVDVLSKVLPADPDTDLSFLLEGDAVLMNSAAYQISPMMVKLGKYATNRETIVHHPKTVYADVYTAITSTDQIGEAVARGNTAYGGHIPFTMLQIVLDYHFLTGFYDADSPIPVGQGARGVVDYFGGIDVLSKELGMTRWDVEHAACEYRKYLYRQDKKLSHYSYKPNSMGV